MEPDKEPEKGAAPPGWDLSDLVKKTPEEKQNYEQQSQAEEQETAALWSHINHYEGVERHWTRKTEAVQKETTNREMLYGVGAFVGAFVVLKLLVR
jgi:hypothetical protein